MRKLPVVLSPDEVARLLSPTTCLKHKTALSVAYGAGLRVAEVSGLKVSDVDSERMLLRVAGGKGEQCRNATLSADMLAVLRQWWKVGRQQGMMHPTLVGGKVINAIGLGPAQFLDREVVDAHFLRIASLAPFRAGVLEVADGLLLLGVD